MGKIISKTVTQDIYVSNDGKETVLTEMNHAHLVNAFGQACANKKDGLSWSMPDSQKQEIVNKLRDEILRRIHDKNEQS